MQKPELFWAYLAGLFDGEGHVGLYKRRRKDVKRGYTWAFVSSIINNDKALIDSLHQDLGTGYIMTETRPNVNHSDSYKLAFSKGDLKQILPKILPYLRSKKRQVELIIEAIPVRSDRERIYRELRELQPTTSSRGRPKKNAYP